ncbi:branched-chain amino acid transport system permease protein [Roseiarcus fermentans]|uniref:Branched-chain amino acid transport system permease protein n=1 Tax=Roseiarcus fermentans TaxID=1473586 RepID=A0A366F1Q9_9HYPH|nr:branched-chain amino acid ABC transporter permease [Roseiarcus fermentans]RBP08588.1 branched-chain amino acid transport system permease protein [Roseiarcus fermentans]
MKRIALAIALAGLLAGCSPVVETDQARLCRMALPALTPDGGEISILSERADPDGRGLEVAFSSSAPGEAPGRHVAACRFRAPGRPRESRDLTALTLDGEPLDEGRLFVLVRYWLATPDGRAADPAPLGGIRDAPVLPRRAVYAIQMAVDGLPLAAVYALLAAAYSLIYGLVGRINFAFGELAAAGGYGAAMTALALAGAPPAPLLAAAFVMAGLVVLGWGYAAAHAVFIPLRNARGLQMMVATVGLAIFLQELLRLAQGDRTSWMTPVLNRPFALARSPDFVAVASPMTFVSAGVALAVAVALVVVFRRTRAGREWRAYADDPLAAEMHGVSPAATLARAFALAGALAGLAGAIMTAAFGAVGYALSATLTLKALAAAIVGGIGSLPGAFLGGLVIGAVETGWSAAFPIDDRDIAVYALMILFIALRPSGLLGKSAVPVGLRQGRS